MNTRQKLTIGIAAIFMVTLTIVGVTYAYFVTQVRTEPGEEAGANVTTATFGSVSFVKDDESVTLNAMADDDEESLNFAVANAEGTADLSYDLVVRHTDGDKLFIKSMLTEGERVDACYNLTETELAAIPTDGECFTGNFYDNVTVTVTRYSDAERTKVEETYTGKLRKATSYDIDTNIPIAAGATHYYTITVKHDDAGVNQNLETQAVVTVIPDIDSIGE